MRNALLLLILCASSLLSAQTLEKSQSIAIYDIVPTVAPCQYCSERAYVRADSSEYRWDGVEWVLWYDGLACVSDLVQDSILVRTCLGVEVDRDTIRVGVGSAPGGTPGLSEVLAENGNAAGQFIYDIQSIAFGDGNVVNPIYFYDGNGQINVGKIGQVPDIFEFNEAYDTGISIARKQDIDPVVADVSNLLDSIPALRADIGSGGGTGVSDQSTITGVGTTGEPFVANSDLINKRIGEFERDSLGTYVRTSKALNGLGTGVYVINTGISPTANLNARIKIGMHYQSNSSFERVDSETSIIFKYTHSTTSIERATAISNGRVPWTTNEVKIGIFGGDIYVFISDEAETADAFFTIKEATFLGSSNYTFDIDNLAIMRSTDLSSGGFTGLHSAIYENTAVIPGATISLSTGSGDKFASIIHYNPANSSGAGPDDIGVYEYYVPANNGSVQVGSPDNTQGVRVGAEFKPYVGALGYEYTIGEGDGGFLRITDDGGFLFNEGSTKRAPLLDYEFVGTDGMVVPIGTTAQRGIGTEGTLRANSTTASYEGHNGTGFFRFMQQTDVTPTDGQIGVWDATTSLYVPTTLTTGTMSSFNVDADTGTASEIEDSETITIAGGTAGIDTEITGNTVTVTLDQGEITANNTAESDMFFLAYDASDAQSWNIDIDVLADYIPTIYNESGDVPSNTTLDTDDGAGITWGTDNVDIHGAEVTINSVKPFLTQTIPIYCQGKDDAPTTGSDYRGWRVPSGMGNSKIVGIQYSYNTPGSDTTIIQLGNGTINFGGTTLPASGYVDVTTNQSILVGQLIKPDISTINGTGHEGLMVNLIIQRN